MKALILALLLIVGSFNAFAAPATCLDPTLLGMSPSASATTNRLALALALAQSLDVCIPPGTYQINDAVGAGFGAFRANQTLRGAGRSLTILQATSSWLSSSNFLTIDTVADVTISDLTIDGNSGDIPGACLIIQGSPRTRVIRIGCINILSNGGVSFQQIPSTTTGSPNGLLTDSYFNNLPNATGAHTVEISISPGVIVSNNIMENVDNGINIAGDASSNVVVIGNRISGLNTSNDGFAGVRCAGGQSVSITGNTIMNTPRGVFLVYCNYSTVTGNTVISTQGQGILINSNNVGPGTQTRGNTVTGNTLINTCVAGLPTCNSAIQIAATGGAAASTTTLNAVVGNTIVDISTGVPTAITTSGVTAGTNLCANNISSMTIGSC